MKYAHAVTLGLTLGIGKNIYKSTSLFDKVDSERRVNCKGTLNIFLS